MFKRLHPAAVLVGLLALAAAGCGKHATTTVRGKVTFGNQPVGMGRVIFLAADNTQGTAQLGADGTYTMTDAPVGDVRIAVEIPQRPNIMTQLPPAPWDKPPADGSQPSVPEAEKMKSSTVPTGTWTYIPDKFKDPSTSGLTWTVPAGGGDHDLPLTP